jgi:ATP-dependent DNA helicase DinG
MNLMSFFPDGYEPLQQQSEIIPRIERAFESGKKFVICCAPTGSGKSFLSKTLANSSSVSTAEYINSINSNQAFSMDQFGKYLDPDNCADMSSFGAIALTITKTLQDQYAMLFNDSKVLKGKSNHVCAIDPKFTVDIAPCIFNSDLKHECQVANKCPYYNARNETLISQFGVLNYSMFLSLPDHVKKRDYLICDEASELEDELVKRFSRELNFKILKKMNISITSIPINNYTKFRSWLENFVGDLSEEVDTLRESLKKKKSNIALADRQKLSLFTNLHMSLKSTIDTWDDCEYILEKTNEAITLKPLRVDKLSQHIFKFGEKILLMSATIIDHKHFARTLGITDYEYIEVDSTFSPKKAPIFCTGKVKLNYKNLKTSLPYIAKQIKNLCDQHKDVKGVIHTHTMEITNYLRNNINDPRFIFRGDGMTNEQILKQHLEDSSPTILVSPSLTYGVDLKDDLARFQILVKAAYMPLGDERIKRLFKEDGQWYVNKMLNNLIQACGRGVRSVDDYCVTYVLDGCIVDAVIQNKTRLPKYFLKRFN